MEIIKQPKDQLDYWCDGVAALVKATAVAHLDDWIKATVPPSEQDRVRDRIVELVGEYPSLLAGRSWPELRVLAEKVVVAAWTTKPGNS